MTQTAEVYQFPKKGAESPRGPQVEDGYTRIANELLEQVMAAPLTLREMRVVMAVIRLTYGWNRKQARVTTGLLAKLTDLPDSIASKTLSGLIAKGVINRHGGSRSPISLNKQADEWKLEAPKHVVPTPKSKCSELEQIAESKLEQNALPSKDMKDITTADAVVERPKRKRKPRIKWTSENLPEGISADVVEAYREHRKAKRSKLTDYALSLIIDKASRVAEETGITGDDVLNMAIEGGWTGLEVKWIRRVLEDRKPDAPVASADIPACPHADILAIWDETCASAKGKAPNLLDWKGTSSSDALEERWAEFYNVEVNGKVRYDSLESGIAWWRMALTKIASLQDFRQSDAKIWDLFYKGRFSKAANGNLCKQMGAVR